MALHTRLVHKLRKENEKTRVRPELLVDEAGRRDEQATAKLHGQDDKDRSRNQGRRTGNQE